MKSDSPSLLHNHILASVARTGILSTLFAVALLASGQNGYTTTMPVTVTVPNVAEETVPSQTSSTLDYLHAYKLKYLPGDHLIHICHIRKSV